LSDHSIFSWNTFKERSEESIKEAK